MIDASNLTAAQARAVAQSLRAGGWARAARGQGNAYWRLVDLGLAEARKSSRVSLAPSTPWGRRRPVVEFRLVGRA